MMALTLQTANSMVGVELFRWLTPFGRVGRVEHFEGYEQVLSVKHAVAQLEISRSTLLRLEKRGIVSPSRTPGGHRRYSQQDLDAVRAHLREVTAQYRAHPNSICHITIGD